MLAQERRKAAAGQSRAAGWPPGMLLKQAHRLLAITAWSQPVITSAIAQPMYVWRETTHPHALSRSNIHPHPHPHAQTHTTAAAPPFFSISLSPMQLSLAALSCLSLLKFHHSCPLGLATGPVLQEPAADNWAKLCHCCLQCGVCSPPMHVADVQDGGIHLGGGRGLQGA